MKVTVKSSRLVKPSKPTWIGCLPLGEFDFTSDMNHLLTIYLYRPSKDWLTPNDTILKTLERSLGDVLVHFYPVAGRLRSTVGGGGRMELDCNAAGVQLMEAEVDVKLDNQKSYTFLSTEFEYLRPPTDCFNHSLEEIPLLLVQVTRFMCGAVAVALSFSHVVADGTSIFHFYSEWARLSRGEPLGSIPLLDRKMIRAGDPPQGSLLCDPHEDLTNELPTLIIGDLNHENQGIMDFEFFKLTNSQVESLKQKANESSKSLIIDGHREYSRYEALTAHIWRSSCRAHNNVPEQPTTMTIAIDTRLRFNPPLPGTYFGNGVIAVRACCCSGDIVSKPLEYASSKIRDTIRRCTNPDYINSLINFFKQEEDLTRFQYVGIGTNMDKLRFSCGNPNLMSVSWLKLPIYDKDFGWGKECMMDLGNCWGNCTFGLLPGQNGDGSIDVLVPLQANYMAAFEKVFYEDMD